MNRVRFLFAILFAVFFVPAWRLLDFISVIWPDPRLYAASFFFCGLLFLFIPLTLAFPKVKKLWFFMGLIMLTAATWWTSPLSSIATMEPRHSHCGRLTYTGFLYPARTFFTAAYEDDLDVRNQLCWVRKMTVRLSRDFDSYEDLENYVKLLNDKLMKPEIKFRASLPSILFLHGMLAGTWEFRSNPINKIQSEALLLNQVKFWTEQYTFEISSREYGWWDWPLAPYIKWEYGLIENNWQKVLEFVNAK